MNAEVLCFVNEVLRRIETSANKAKLLAAFNSLLNTTDSKTFTAICSCFLDDSNGEDFILGFAPFQAEYEDAAKLINEIVFNEIANINSAEAKYSIENITDISDLIKAYINYNTPSINIQDNDEVSNNEIPIVDFNSDGQGALKIKTESGVDSYYPSYIPADAISNIKLYSTFASNNSFSENELKRAISLERYIKSKK